MGWAGDLRRELSARNQQIAVMNGSVHELTAGEMPSVIFGRNESRPHGNFYPTSWRNVCANPAVAPARQGPYRIAQRTAPSGLAMEGTGLREQLGCVAHEYLLLPTHARQSCVDFH